MFPLTADWQMELERGPDWVFIRLLSSEQAGWQGAGLAEALWNVMQTQMASRLVLHMDHVPMLRSEMLGELVRLHKRIHARGGLLRLCGLSPSNQQVLQLSQLSNLIPSYASREEAVLGYRPGNPR